MEKPENRDCVPLVGRIILGLIVLGSVFIFLRAIVLRAFACFGVSAQAGDPYVSGGPVLWAFALGFLVLFLGGVCYAFWAMLMQYYIAFSLTRHWISEILREPGKIEEWVGDQHRFAT
ncbi:MAG: hypothetical protein ACUVRC_05740 [Desulfotomaculales bacterium]